MVRGMLEGTARAAVERDPLCVVLQDLELDSPAGCFLFRARFIQVAYLAPDRRGSGLGLRAGAVAVEHFFATTAEPDLGTDNVTQDGRRLLTKLGFGGGQQGDKLTLSREHWRGHSAQFARLFHR